MRNGPWRWPGAGPRYDAGTCAWSRDRRWSRRPERWNYAITRRRRPPVGQPAERPGLRHPVLFHITYEPRASAELHPATVVDRRPAADRDEFEVYEIRSWTRFTRDKQNQRSQTLRGFSAESYLNFTAVP
jgi:hypothetical protein